MKKLGISIFILLTAITSYFAFSQLNKNDELGEITITVVDEIGDTISSTQYPFTEDDTLFSILAENYDVGCADSSYHLSDVCEKQVFNSRIILKIDTIETDWHNTYISIYENGEYSNLGIDSIILNDGDVFLFKYTVVGDGE